MYYEIVTAALNSGMQFDFDDAASTCGVYMAVFPDGSAMSRYPYYYVMIVSKSGTSEVSPVMLRIAKPDAEPEYIHGMFSIEESNRNTFRNAVYLKTDLTFGVSLFVKENEDD